ncbi:MAG: AmmeMemoRadiSam system radical SAM enzyme [Thermodesulfobacteriota bacterium]|nr:AmmeMemoRadiSam system radical SAM enzyme [Thermodesulfobacteriota bacterium]
MDQEAIKHFQSLGNQNQLTKREFLGLCWKGLFALCASQLFGFPENSRAHMAKKGLIKTKLSPYYTSLSKGRIRCELCPRRCLVSKGERGFCRVRENREGKFYSLVYGNPSIIHYDPIEKESFSHVLPGTICLTLSTAGCNLECKFCENWEISQAFPEDVFSYDISPEMIVRKAEEMRVHSIAYTYAEPTIFYEYMSDIAHLARRAGLRNVLHSNGFIHQRPLRDLCQVLDAAQIDLKGFSNEFYRELSNGKLAPVLDTLKILKEEKVHVEITNLVIPTKNDDMSLIREMCLWMKGALGPDTPLHFTRFYPLHKLQRLPSTPISILEKARAVALSAGLEYVYIGKVPGHEAWDTFCPKCKRRIIQRTGYMISQMLMTGGECNFCGKSIPGIWK